MDGQRFDQLARTLVRGTSRRRLLKSAVGGAIGGTCARLQTADVRAQSPCTWSGTFQTTFGGITMTLTESGGQVSGSYTFSDNGIPSSGTISGIVRTTEIPGETILEGIWREPVEGGRLWFSMLEPCTQFTGWYTGTDVSEEWISGWDGVRTSGVPTGGGGDVETTLFSNPGDTRAASYVIEGQAVTLFGPKDADGGVEYINHALIDSPDGDPQKRVFLDFDAAGTPTRAMLASGETMSFEWTSPTRVVITYQSADGSQEVQFPYDATPAAVTGLTTPARASVTRARADAGVGLLAYAGGSHLTRTLKKRSALPAAQNPLGNPGTVEVQCGAGTLVPGATVTGTMEPANMPGTALDVSFTETTPGVFAYSLPIAPAPPPLEGFHRTRLERALLILCAGNAAMFITQAAANSVCAYLLGVPAAGTAGFAACVLFINSYRLLCALNTARMATGAAVDFFAGSFVVKARGQHPKLGNSQITINASAGSAIPRSVIQLTGGAGIDSITTVPLDPNPQEGYTVTVSTVCVPAGSQLSMSVVGTDNYAPPPTVVIIAESEETGTLVVPGAEQGILDTITVELSGPLISPDIQTKQIVF